MVTTAKQVRNHFTPEQTKRRNFLIGEEMKKLITLFVFLLLSQYSFANCGNQAPEEPKRRCSYLEIVVQTVTENMNDAVRLIEKSENIPESKKQIFRDNQERFFNRIQNQCQSNLECVRDNMVKRLLELKIFYCDYNECQPTKPAG